MADTQLEYEPEVMPAWLRGTWGKRWAQAFGVLKNGIAEAASLAVKSRFTSLMPSDAITHRAREVGHERAPGEAEAAHRERMGRCWSQWEKAGRDIGIIDALADVGYTARIKHNWEWDPDGTGQPDSDWAKFWVIIEPPHSFTLPPAWEDFFWGDGTRFGVGGSSGESLSQILRTIKKWQGSHTKFVRLYIVVDPVGWADFEAGIDPDPYTSAAVIDP